MKEMLKMPKMKPNGDSGRRAHLAAHAAANRGRLPTRTRPETQQSGLHSPCRARVQIYGANKTHLRLYSKFGGISEQNGWRREAPVVLQSSLVTRRPARHPPARGRLPPPFLSTRIAGQGHPCVLVLDQRGVREVGTVSPSASRRQPSPRITSRHVRGHPATRQPAPARA
jgi:hypothetical protein